MQERDPFSRFERSIRAAAERETFDASRAALATADGRGGVSVRFVLIKEWTPPYFYFFTSYESRKARDLEQNPHAALAFHWSTTGEQVRVEGRVERAPTERSDAYFAARPRESQIGAWASLQSQELGERSELETRVAELEQRFAGGPVPRPPFWGGYQLEARTIEFWHDRPGRLHDRILYTRREGDWSTCRLYP